MEANHEVSAIRVLWSTALGKEKALRLHLRGGGIIGQGEAVGVQCAGILGCRNHCASGGAGAEGVVKEAQEGASVRLEGKRA